MTVIAPPGAGGHPVVPGPGRPGLEASLRTVTEALEVDARRQSLLTLSRADADADATLEVARTEGERLIQAARAEGAATAQRLAAAQLADARREARHTVLEAQRALFEAVRQGALEQLVSQADTPAAAELVARLGDVARARLGDHAEVRRPDRGRPGIVARRDGVVLDLSAPVLVDLELPRLGGVLEGLWA